mmetsp:Transcript_2331/g.4823  ORF Transcript_2331/g.4823 Transcript_2331/m.4823 type:complete len:183 (-) Transcript_2331:131-679(-)
MESGKMYVSDKRDRLGRPIIINRKTKHRPADDRLQLKLLAYNMEKAVASMGPQEKGCFAGAVDKFQGEEQHNPDGQWLWILDLKHWSRKSSPPMSVTKETAKMLTHHYPERLGDLFIINAPGIFRFFWKLMQPFVDERTRKKIHFTSGDKMKELLLQYIEPENLEEEFGGQHVYNYSVDYEK